MSESPDLAYKRLPSLTGFRAIAAFLVFLNHGVYLFVFADQGVQSGYQFVGDYLGSLGVTFFFVLSGFVLTWSMGKTTRAGRFWRSRVVKIFPNHLVVFAVGFALLVASGAPIQAAEAVANLFLVQGWIPDPTYTFFAVNGVTWSLSAELLFYALFPLLLVLIRKVRQERLWFWTVAVGALVLLLPVLSELLPSSPPNPFSTETSWAQMWFLYFFPVTRCLEFVLGMLLARIVQTGRWIGLGVAPAALLLVGAYTASLYLPLAYRYVAMYVLPVALLIGAAAVSDAKGRRGFLQTRVMQFLGNISFAFFVVHLVVVQGLRAAVEGKFAGYGFLPTESWSTGVGILFLLGVLIISGLLATVLHLYVEQPAMRRWARRRTPEPAVPHGEGAKLTAVAPDRRPGDA